MKELKGSQRKYLRGIAHDLKPSAYVGQNGLTENLVKEISQGLHANELIKVKFVEYKEKQVKALMAQQIADKTDSHLAGIIGHIAIYYKEHLEPEKRKIQLS